MIKSVEKAMRLLEILSRADDAMRLRDIAAESGMTRSNTLKLLQTLRELGYVQNAADGRRHKLTLKLFEVGARKVSKDSLVRAAHPVLQNLSEIVSENIMLSVREGLSSVVVDRIESRSFVRTFAYLGARAPLHVVSGGKTLLAWASDNLIDSACLQLDKFTDQTITNPDKLHAELAKVRAQGYATAVREVNDAARGISVPVRSYLGEVVAALSISGPMENFGPELIEKYSEILKRHAANIEAAWPDGLDSVSDQDSVPRPSKA